MRSGDIGDEAGRSAADAGPLDLDAVRADDDLIEALSAGLVPPPSEPRDTADIEGELVALLAGWVADVRPETLLHRPPPLSPVAPLPAEPETDAERTSELAAVGAAEDQESGASMDAAVVRPVRPRPLSLLEYDDVTQPVLLDRWRRFPAKPYVLRAAAALVAIALVGSGVIARSYEARPGEALWAVAQMVFPAKSHSVEASISVSTALNTARVALERGRVDEAREAFQTVAAQLGDVDDADGRAELKQQMDYVHAQLVAAPAPANANPNARTPGGPRSTLAVGAAGAVIPSSPAVTPGANAALATTLAPSPSSALAAGPSSPADVTSTGGRPPTEGNPSAPAVVAAPAPSGEAFSAPPAVSAPPDVSGPSVEPPPANPAPVVDNPPAPAPTTTEPPAPTTDPPATAPTSDSVAPPQQRAGDPGTQDANSSPAANDPAAQSNNAATDSAGADNANANANTDNASTDSSKTDAQSSADTASPASDGTSADAAGVSIDAAGAVGSTLGQVTGVVTNTAGA